MNSEGFKIYVDRLHDGKVEQIDECFDASFLEQDTEDLAYKDQVSAKGEAYIAENELIIHLDIHTTATVPCTICNKPVDIPVDMTGVYLIESLDNTKSGIFIFKDLLREAILLESPTFSECSNGNCPKRREFSKFLVEEGTSSKKSVDSNDDGYHPFANLEL